jgi:hypothetical protein
MSVEEEKLKISLFNFEDFLEKRKKNKEKIQSESV